MWGARCSGTYPLITVDADVFCPSQYCMIYSWSGGHIAADRAVLDHPQERTEEPPALGRMNASEPAGTVESARIGAGVDSLGERYSPPLGDRIPAIQRLSVCNAKALIFSIPVADVREAADFCEQNPCPAPFHGRFRLRHEKPLPPARRGSPNSQTVGSSATIVERSIFRLSSFRCELLGSKHARHLAPHRPKLDWKLAFWKWGTSETVVIETRRIACDSGSAGAEIAALIGPVGQIKRIGDDGAPIG